MRSLATRGPGTLFSLSLLPFTLILAASAQTTSLPRGKDLTALIERMKTNQTANDKVAQQYTSVMVWHNLNFNKSGKTTVDESKKYENVFVEGLPYSRLVEYNGKPLEGKAAEAEQKRYDKAVEERKNMSLDEKRHSFRVSFHSALPMGYLTSLYDNRAVRREDIDGRETLVVESTPRSDARPDDTAAKTALDWKQTTWIDVRDEMPVRFIAEKLNDSNHDLKGTTLQFDFVRLVDQSTEGASPGQPVWIQKEFKSTFRMKMMFMTFNRITEQTWNDFKKFHVDVRLLLDTMTEAEKQKPAARQPQNQ